MLNNTLRKNNGDSMFVVIFALVAMIMILLILHKVSKYLETHPETFNQNRVEVVENNTDDDEENNNSENLVEDLSFWNGTYENDDFSVIIIRSDDKKFEFCLSKNNMNPIDIYIDLKETNKLEVENDEYTISVEYLEGKIKIEGTSKKEDSILNLINDFNSTLTKNEFESYGWDGIYSNENIKIILAQIDEKNIILRISDGDNIFAKQIEVNNKMSISYEDSEKEKIQINKTENGIYIEASAEDEKSILNTLENNFIFNN